MFALEHYADQADNLQGLTEQYLFQCGRVYPRPSVIAIARFLHRCGSEC